MEQKQKKKLKSKKFNKNDIETYSIKNILNRHNFNKGVKEDKLKFLFNRVNELGAFRKKKFLPFKAAVEKMKEERNLKKKKPV